MSIENLAIFAGNANPDLAQEAARYLGSSIGKALVNSFSDGEVNVEILENVRGQKQMSKPGWVNVLNREN